MLAEHSEMVCRGIAPMTCKAVLREFLIEFIHDPVAGHLGQDAGGRDTEAEPIATDESRLLHRESFGRQSIHEDMGGRMSVFFQSI